MSFLRTVLTSPLLWGAVLSAACAVAAYQIGDGYIERLPNHQGYFLVGVDDAGWSGEVARPARTVLIVVDGLRRDAALTTRAVARLNDAGQCRVSHVGEYTVSRPIAALIGTGLEVARAGSRNNRQTAPLAAESVLDTAREAGMTVLGYSHTIMWQELFPGGFDRYVNQPEPPERTDLFAGAELAQLTLFHPLYVDDAGHNHGASSSEYRAAVERADREITGLLDRLDLSRDVVVITADHGHTPSGGHGGPQPHISEVLTCFAGAGIRRTDDIDRMDSRTIAPTLAVRLGVRFPRHMRAVEDDLDTLWSILATEQLSADYVANRKQAIEQFRAHNRAQLARWLGLSDEASATWSALYDEQASKQLMRWAIALLVIAVLLAASIWRRRLGWRQAVAMALWITGVAAAACVVYMVIKGGFDFNTINKRSAFLRSTVTITMVTGVLGVIVHFALWRDIERLVLDHVTLLGLALAFSVAHRFVYGVPLGFPLPGRILLFVPFFAAILLLGHAIIALGVCALGAVMRVVRQRDASA